MLIWSACSPQVIPLLFVMIFCHQFLSIWLWKYLNCSFWCVLLGTFEPFQSFFALAFVGFLWLRKDVFEVISVFQTTIDSHETLYFAMACLVCKHLPLLWWQGQSFHIRHSKYVFQMSPEENQIWFLQLLFIYC